MRKAEAERTTKETSIFIALDLDGQGESRISTELPFLTHMLELFARHGLFDLEIRAAGDIEIDGHHTAEDIGIVLGQVFMKALGDRRSISRFGHAVVPMDECLSSASVDISNRPFFKFDVDVDKIKLGTLDSEVIREFFQAFAFNARINLHLKNEYGNNAHHIFESLFKACSRALRQSVELDPRVPGLLTTKEVF